MPEKVLYNPTNTMKQKWRGLMRHLDMVLTEDQKQADLNSRKGWERPLFADARGIGGALNAIRARCVELLYPNQ